MGACQMLLKSLWVSFQQPEQLRQFRYEAKLLPYYWLYLHCEKHAPHILHGIETWPDFDLRIRLVLPVSCEPIVYMQTA